MTSHRMAVQEHQNWLRHHGEMIAHFLRVGKMSIQIPSNSVPSPQAAPVVGITPLALQDICIAATEGLPPALQWDGLQNWLTWLQGIEDVQASVRWISWVELLIHFQQSSGIRGMKCHNRGHQRQWHRISVTEDISMRKLASSFAQFGWNVIRHFDKSWKTVQRRPSSHRLQAWLNCIPIRVKDTVLQEIGSWLDSHDIKVFKPKDIDLIPCAI